MTVRFNSHLTSIPGYTPGVPKGHTAEDVAGSDLAQLASNESPFPPPAAALTSQSGPRGLSRRQRELVPSYQHTAMLCCRTV